MEEKKIQLRLPESLRFSIEAAAKRNGRSMNAEILECLKAGIPDVSKLFFSPENLGVIRQKLDEDENHFFSRMILACNKKLLAESECYSYIGTQKLQQSHWLTHSLSKWMEWGWQLPIKLPSADDLRRAEPSAKYQYDEGLFNYLKIEKETARIVSTLPIKKMETQIAWDAFEKILRQKEKEKTS